MTPEKNKKESEKVAEEKGENNPNKKEDPSEDIEQLEQELKKVDQEVFEGVPDEKKREILTASLSIIRERYFSGPIPPPDLMAQYNNVIDDGAERIMVMAEDTNAVFVEEKRSEISDKTRGQYMGFIIVFLVLALTGFLAYLGEGILSGIFGVGGLSALAYIFVVARWSEEGKHK